jgi:hypothetical protein
MGNGDTPHIVRGGQADYKRLYYSNPDQALKKDVSLVAGFGVIPQGTGLAKVTAGTNKGKFVPYNPATISSAVKYTGQAYLVADVGVGTDVYVTMDDSYKFAVGDQLYVADNNTKTSSATDCGLITAIDRTTYTHMAKITITNTLAADFTVAQSACVFHIAGADNTNTFSDCAGILELAVDTGVGENAKGGDGTMILSNAILYNGMLTNIDAAARTDMSATVDGQYLIMK